MYRRQAFYILDDDTGQYRMVERIVCHDPDRAWITCGENSTGQELRMSLCWYEWHRLRRSGEILTPSEYADAQPKRGREEARRALTAEPGTENHVTFVKRTDGSVRRMRFRYDPERPVPFDPVEKGLLPVWDLDNNANRYINLDGVLH